jgi:hypothetical protein
MSSNPFAVTAEYTLTTKSGLPAPTGPLPGTPNVTVTGTLASGSTTVTVPSTSGLAVGYGVTGNGIPTGTTISQIDSTQSQVMLSQNASASGSESLVFTPNVSPPQVVAQIVPAGGVYTPPTTSAVGPLTVLASSKGFTTSGLYDSLATTTDSSGKLEQLLGLSFYGQGLKAGGELDFTLAITNPSSPPQLKSLVDGVTITLDQPPTSSDGSGSIVNAQTPEPLSLLLWSALALAGLVRARAARRTPRVTTCND